MTRSRTGFCSRPLEQEILARPYQVVTRWRVITGAPSCGKTTLINQLADEGYRTVPETAHIYLKQEMTKGRPLKEILADRVEFQRILIQMQREIESRLSPEELFFLDRSLADNLSFSRLVGIDPNLLLPDFLIWRYQQIFILDPLPYHKNGVRDYDAANVAFLDEWLERDYRALGYRVERVPVLPPPERLAYLLGRIS